MSSSAVPPEQPLVLRAQLPLPRAYVAPRTLTERLLAEIWRAALSMDLVGAEDRYSDLGGDSFLALIILNGIENKFQVAIPLAVFIEAPTIAALASRIDGLLPNAPAGGL
jgi:acyl carrier protein